MFKPRLVSTISLIVICILILSFLPFKIAKFNNLPKQVTYYGMAAYNGYGFLYYDIEKDDLEKINDQYTLDSFWAKPSSTFFGKSITDDEIMFYKFRRFIEDNPNVVFRITGTKNEDDCGYYRNYENEDRCMSSILVNKIEIYKTSAIDTNLVYYYPLNLLDVYHTNLPIK
ncbi:MAG: hypothetical protein AAB377_00660 [Patescibacteria group bacterium]